MHDDWFSREANKVRKDRYDIHDSEQVEVKDVTVLVLVCIT